MLLSLVDLRFPYLVKSVLSSYDECTMVIEFFFPLDCLHSISQAQAASLYKYSHSFSETITATVCRPLNTTKAPSSGCKGGVSPRALLRESASERRSDAFRGSSTIIQGIGQTRRFNTFPNDIHYEDVR